jgi:hypothetical protein
MVEDVELVVDVELVETAARRHIVCDPRLDIFRPVAAARMTQLGHPAHPEVVPPRCGIPTGSGPRKRGYWPKRTKWNDIIGVFAHPDDISRRCWPSAAAR